MNDKLMRRAAIKYREWLMAQERSPVQSSRDNILNNIDRAKSKTDQVEKWASRFFKGSAIRIQQSPWDQRVHEGIICPSVYKRIATDMIPELGEDAIYSLKHVLETIKSLAMKKVVIVPSPREAIEEITAITNCWPDVEFKGGTLSVRIDAVSLEDEDEEVDLGDFWIHLDLHRPLDGLRIESISYVESENGFTHPHVYGSKLCIGAGRLPSVDALCQGRLEDYFLIVEAVLRTYNSMSPHEELRQWYNPSHEGKFYCEGCEEYRSEESSCWCEGCQTTTCEYCNEGGGCCTECGEWYCEECSNYCHGCEETLCNHCATGCDGCDENFCSSCMGSCEACDNKFCKGCTETSCAHCGDTVCESCIATCGCCKEVCCVNCVEDFCKECVTSICQGCSTTCDECGKVLCETCEKNSCDECGTKMCETCEGSHTCLLSEITTNE